MHNHFEANYYIGNKKALFYNIKKYYQVKGFDPFTFLPLTFHISKGLNDQDYKNFLSSNSVLSKTKAMDDIRNRVNEKTKDTTLSPLILYIILWSDDGSSQS